MKVPKNTDLPVIRAHYNERALVFAIILAVGLIFTIVGAVFGGKLLGSKLRCTDEVQATVVELIRRDVSGENGTSISYAPRFEFVYNGEKRTYESSVSSNPAEYRVGEVSRLMINPDDPEEIYEPDSSVGWILVFGAGGAGLIAAVSGVVGLIVNIARMRAKPVDELASYQARQDSSLDDIS